jgi:hypothetical protein
MVSLKPWSEPRPGKAAPTSGRLPVAVPYAPQAPLT